MRKKKKKQPTRRKSQSVPIIPLSAYRAYLAISRDIAEITARVISLLRGEEGIYNEALRRVGERLNALEAVAHSPKDLTDALARTESRLTAVEAMLAGGDAK